MKTAIDTRDAYGSVTIDLNSYISGWLNEANNRIHGTTNKKPIEMLNNEVPYFVHYSDLVMQLQ